MVYAPMVAPRHSTHRLQTVQQDAVSIASDDDDVNATIIQRACFTLDKYLKPWYNDFM
jgi:hypothetical protein